MQIYIYIVISNIIILHIIDQKLQYVVTYFILCKFLKKTDKKWLYPKHEKLSFVNFSYTQET